MPRPPRPLPSQSAFARHLGRNALLALTIALAALGIGAMGFRYLNGLGWLDATLDASLTLNGVGPVNPIGGSAAKVFVTIYALLGGLVYLSTVGILLAPLARRLMYRLHLDMYGEETDDDDT